MEEPRLSINNYLVVTQLKSDDVRAQTQIFVVSESVFFHYII